MNDKILREYSGCKVAITFKHEGDKGLKDRVLNMLLESYHERVAESGNNNDLQKAS